MSHPINTMKVIRHYAFFRKNGHSPRSAAINCIWLYSKDADEIKRRIAKL